MMKGSPNDNLRERELATYRLGVHEKSLASALGQPGPQNIARGVYVRMLAVPTRYAGELLLVTVLGCDFTAVRAPLARVPGVHRHDPPTSICQG